MFCTHCGAEMAPHFEFCPKCGASMGKAPAPPTQLTVNTEFIAPSGCRAQTGRWISEGWRLMSGQVGMLMLITLLAIVVSSVVPLILQGPMLIGMHIVCWRVILGGRADVGDVFKGFTFFVPSLLAVIVTALFVALGMLACLVGALVVTAMYQFTYLFIADRKLDFWPAMKASHAIVKQDYFGFTIFVLATILLHLIGALACLVGLLVTIPLQFMAVTVAYKELVGFASPAPPE